MLPYYMEHTDEGFVIYPIQTNVNYFCHPIIKCANCNMIPIQNCTSIYQMKLCTVGSSLIISRRNLYSSKDTDLVIQLNIHYAINVKYIWVTKIVIKQMGRNLSGHIFIGVFYTAKTSTIILLLSLFGKLFLWDIVNGDLRRLYSNLRHATTVFWLQIHNQYLWI